MPHYHRNDMEQGYYGKIETPREAIYEAACALDNQDVPLEDWPVKLIAALARAGFAVVPVELPYDALAPGCDCRCSRNGEPKARMGFPDRRDPCGITPIERPAHHAENDE